MYPSQDDEGETIELTSGSRYSYDDDEFAAPHEAASHALLSPETSSTNEFDVETGAAGIRKRRTPIPKLQVMTLCAVRIVDPIRYLSTSHRMF